MTELDKLRSEVQALRDEISAWREGSKAVTKALSEMRADRDRLAAANVALEAKLARLARDEMADDAASFDRADWFWRTMDPDDCGDSPEEAINRAMVGRFCVCEIASSYAGPTRYGFIAPVLDPESDDEEFVHFATQQEAIIEAKRRAALAEVQARDEGAKP